VFIYFSVSREGAEGGKDVCWRQRWWGFMNCVGRVGKKGGKQKKKKGNGLLDLVLVVGGDNTVVRSAGNDGGRAVDVKNDLDRSNRSRGGLLETTRKGDELLSCSLSQKN